MTAMHNADQEAIDAYGHLKNSLSAEQHALCCYCEREIEPTSPQCHVEHVRPRCSFPQDTFRYDNLGCSCNGRSGTDKHCGHLKGGKYDDALFICPHNPLIRGLLTYDVEGGIGPSDPAREQQARHMIETLGLDCARLVSMRGGHGKGLVSTIDGFLAHENAHEFITLFAQEYIAPRADGTLHPFYSLSQQIFANHETSNVPGEPA